MLRTHQRASLFLLWTILSTASFAWAAQEENVLTLTSHNFDKTLDENDIVLVEFYAPWCGHCKQLAPEYEKAAKMLKEKDSSVKLGKVDATAETDLADKYEIRGYPTMHLFRRRKMEEYRGGRTAETIVEWIESVTGPALVLTDEPIEPKMEAENIKIAYLAKIKSKDSEFYRTFENIADSSRMYGRFFSSIDPQEDSVSVFRLDEGEFKMKEPVTEENVKRFVYEEAFPLFGPINGENFRSYDDRNLDLVWFCGEKKHFDASKAAIRSVAEGKRGLLSFVWLDTEQFKGHAENALGVSEFPALVYQSKKGRFVLPEPGKEIGDAQVIGNFFAEVEAGKIERSLKSEPIPEENNEPVKVVVGKTFESIVLHPDKDVLLKVYAPWCGHCKKMEPAYAEFAENMKKFDHILVAKMDGTTNESPLENFTWSGFPTIFFVKAGTNTPINFNGPRTVEGLTDFVKEQTSKPLEVPTEKGEEL